MDTKHQQQGATSQRVGRTNTDAQRNENFRSVCGRCGATRQDSQLGLEPTPEEYVANINGDYLKQQLERAVADGKATPPEGSLWATDEA